ncbi:MAG: hypothetical protein QNJ44_05120 [Rhodobacter sp.]|nr:hypothetical protein [Rhodobacter sp.]
MTAAFSLFSPQQWHVLRALSLYRFLTVDQMLHLGISRNAKSLRDKSLFALRHHGCIQSEKIGSFLPDVHYMNAKGAAILEELEGVALDATPSKKRQPFSALFAPHRFAQVDFHIGVRQWAESRGDVEVLLELQDFVRQPRAATELQVPGLVNSVIPDGLFAVGTNSGQEAVYAVEIHRATQSKAVAGQLSQYFEVIKSAAIAQTHGVTANPIICSVHQQPAVLASVKARLAAHDGFAPFRQNFVFHTLDDLRDNFTGGWHLADDTPAQPFPLPKPKRDA